MSVAVLSNDFRIEIPEELRASMKLRAGQEFSLVRIGQTIQIVPVRSPSELKGSLPGLPTDGFREKSDRPL